MSRIAVTGGAGFVGTNLVRALLKENHEVVIIDDFSTGLKSNLIGLDVQVHEISLVDADKVSKALEKSEYIFHLGARGSVPRSIKNPRATMDVNVTGTLNILEFARRAGAAVAFSSSSSVYGSNLELPKNEKMWMAPLTPYAASKLSGEALIASYAASFVPNRLFREDDKVCLAREILVRYGNQEKVRNSLAANFSTDGWSGAASIFYQQKRKILLDFKEGEDNTNVRDWIDSYVDMLEKYIESAEINEERMAM